MKKIALFSFFIGLLWVALPSSAAAQENGFRLGVDYYPNFSVLLSDESLARSASEPKLSHSVGLTLSRQVSRRVELATGIIYSNIGYQRQLDGLRWGTQHNGNGGFDPGLDPEDAFSDAEIRYNYDFVALPLTVKYIFLDKGIRLYAGGGLSARYNINNFTVAIGGGSRKRESMDRDIQRFSLGLQSGAGVEKAIGRRLLLFLEPRVQLNWLDGLEEGLMSYGLALGIRGS